MSIKVNQAGVNHANSLIDQGKVDKESDLYIPHGSDNTMEVTLKSTFL